MKAVQNNNIEIAKVLLAKGAGKDIKDDQDISHLMSARDSQKQEIIALLKR